MTLPAAQRGSLLIIAVVMIVVVGFLSSVVAFLAVGQISASTDGNSAVEAFYLAESGLERGTRQWLQNPGVYAGEGPVALGGGTFTVTASGVDATGAALPAYQQRITSLGQAAAAGGAAARTTEAIVQSGGSFTEPFPNINNWLTVGPTGEDFYLACALAGRRTTAPFTQGTVSFDPAENAPGSTGGAFRAQVVSGNSGEELGGYRQFTLPTPIVTGQNITLSLWFKKILGAPDPKDMTMAIDFVDTADTVYRPWSDCAAADVPWTAASVVWTVPAATTINRVRLSFYLQNGKKKGATAPSAVLFDQVTLSVPTTTGVLSWREVIP